MATELPWRKSGFTANGQCVEVAKLPNGDTAVHNGNRPDAGTVVFTRPRAPSSRAPRPAEFDGHPV